ncbi:MAG: putative glycoside hydrolase, partial [Bacteroidota bacterium]
MRQRYMHLPLLFSACLAAFAADKAEPSEANVAAPARIFRTGAELCYGLSPEGFHVSRDGGRTWTVGNRGLPKKVVYPFKEQKVRPLTALGFDPARPARVAVTTPCGIHLSEDGGSTWRQIAPASRLAKNAYPTAVALSPAENDTLLVGTSFDGLFESKDLGRTWTCLSRNLTPLYRGAGCWEEISALAYVPDDPKCILLACGFGQGLYRLDRTNGKLHAWRPAGLTGREQVDFLGFRHDAGASSWQLILGTGGASYTYAEEHGEPRVEVPVCPPPAEDPSRRERALRGTGRYAIYLRPDQAAGKRFDAHLDFMKKNGFNAVVVDFKDDYGFLTYDSRLERAKRMGAVRKILEAGEFISKARRNGIYVVARLVVFKDKQLYHDQKYRCAVWDGPSNAPWRNLVKKDGQLVQGEYWVEPFCPEVWEYNLAVAEELQALGVDEIQFDYLRFPTDGPTARIRYRYRREGMEKSDAIESFLAMARERLRIPLSVDLYGFNCWYRMEGLTGQNMSIIADYVDAVCPMFYPSHFPATFIEDRDYLARARRIYLEGTSRAYAIANGRTLIRPYIQAFLLGGERRMGSPSYTKYLFN